MTLNEQNKHTSRPSQRSASEYKFHHYLRPHKEFPTCNMTSNENKLKENNITYLCIPAAVLDWQLKLKQEKQRRCLCFYTHSSPCQHLPPTVHWGIWFCLVVSADVSCDHNQKKRNPSFLFPSYIAYTFRPLKENPNLKPQIICVTWFVWFFLEF